MNDHNADECKRFAGELLPCPFCGDAPDFPSGDGTQYEIECGECGGAMVSVQISDLMTIEERSSDSFINYRYAEKFIERAKVRAVELWNTRAAQPAPVVPEGWREFIADCATTAGNMVNGNRLSARAAELLAAAPAQGQQVEFGDAYRGAREDMAIWKRRALEAEEKLRTQCDGQSFMGEPLVQPYEAPREKVETLFKQLGFSGQVSVGEILDAALAALKAQQADDWLTLAHEVESLGNRYWKAAVRERGPGAVQWLKNEETGAMFVFTRGEYSEQLKEFCMSLPLAQEVKAQQVGNEPATEVSEETFSSDGTSDIITRKLPIGTKLYTTPQPAPAQDVAEKDALLREFLDVCTGGFADDDHVRRLRLRLEALAAHDKQSGGEA